MYLELAMHWYSIVEIKLFTKILGVTFGVLTTIIAFVTEYLGKTIVQVVITLFGTFGGPILAIYSIGMHFPWINTAVRKDSLN